MIGRPAPGDIDPYYFPYIDKVKGDDCLSAMAGQLGTSLSLFAQISEEKSSYRYAPDKWSLRQVLNHITDTERVFVQRAFWFARGFETPLPGFDQEVAAAASEADRLPWAAHIKEFRSVRLSTIDFFRSLPPAAWARRGTASGKPFTVLALGFLVPGHLTHHLERVRERYL
jgi:DinB superfamily